MGGSRTRPHGIFPAPLRSNLVSNYRPSTATCSTSPTVVIAVAVTVAGIVRKWRVRCTVGIVVVAPVIVPAVVVVGANSVIAIVRVTVAGISVPIAV